VIGKAPARRMSRMKCVCLACLALGIVLQTSGCAIDFDAVATSAAEAVLNTVADSLVESLSTYLEGT